MLIILQVIELFTWEDNAHCNCYYVCHFYPYALLPIIFNKYFKPSEVIHITHTTAFLVLHRIWIYDSWLEVCFSFFYVILNLLFFGVCVCVYQSLFYVRAVGCCNNMYYSVAIHHECHMSRHFALPNGTDKKLSSSFEAPFCWWRRQKPSANGRQLFGRHVCASRCSSLELETRVVERRISQNNFVAAKGLDCWGGERICCTSSWY